MTEYYKSRLTPAQAKVYDDILFAARRGDSTVEFSGFSQQEGSRLYFDVYRDHPELFELASGVTVGVRSMGFFSQVSIKFQMIYDPATTARFRKEIDQQAAQLVGECASLSEEEKVIRVAEFLVERADYAIDNQYNQNAASALCVGKAQCSGYSRAAKLLFDRLGVWSTVVEGQAKGRDGGTGPHMWTIVRLDGQYYHVDVTYMEGANMGHTLPLNRHYLFYDDASLSATHAWDRTLVPPCVDTSRKIDLMDRSGRGQYSQSPPRRPAPPPPRPFQSARQPDPPVSTTPDPSGQSGAAPTPPPKRQGLFSQLFDGLQNGRKNPLFSFGTKQNGQQTPKPSGQSQPNRQPQPSGQSQPNRQTQPSGQPQPSRQPQPNRQTPPPATGQGDALPKNCVRCGTLQELRDRVRECLGRKEQTLVVYLEIKTATDNELMKLAQSAVRMVATSMNIDLSYKTQITLPQKFLTFTFQY